MSDAWKKLQESNRQSDALRQKEERQYTREFLYLLPLLPASFLLTFSDETAVDVVSQVQFLDSIRQLASPVLTAYLIVIAYLILIVVVEWGFYRPLNSTVRIIVAWFMWGWFYYSTWVLQDIRFAFAVAFIAAIFMLRIVGWLSFCYETIRKGMFLGRSDKKP